ncbi:hypothetical protein DQE94_05790 [Shigella flexneri]|nr:hypothetical protein [Shigella flexneri]EGD9721580.1 hypothetical protein [Shigella flexneri]EGE3168464.1 hypothetical protein [Shigella flexneri]EGE3998520.1 hypothetical protein [Shigella flexneri]
MSISRSQCAGQKNIAKSGAGTQNRIEVAGKKNAALFEWAAFVKAEKSELVLLESEYLVSASVPCVVRLCWWCVGVYVHAYVHTLRGCRLKQDVKAAFMVL